MTTVLLRAASLAVNVAFAFGLPWWLTGRVWVAAAIATVFFGVVAWASRRAPPYRAACDDVSEIATQVCERLGAPPPRFVGECDGWTAGVVRSSGGYGFILGHRVEPEHRGAVLAHEVAHALSGDLSWEPWTDGPARLMEPLVQRVPPFGVILFPFFLFAAPLARWTELRADEFAAQHWPGYTAVLRAVADKMSVRASLFYPSLDARITRSARHS